MEDLNRQFSKEDMQMASQEAYVKVLSISHQGNANQNHNEMLLPIPYDG